MKFNRKIYVSDSLEDSSCIAQDISSLCSRRNLLLLNGELGSGKTTLVEMLCRNLGFNGPVNSPTFGKIHEYHSNDLNIYHLDLYRSPPNFLELEELMVDSRYLICIEWAQLFQEEISDCLESTIHRPDLIITVDIESDDRGARMFTIQYSKTE